MNGPCSGIQVLDLSFGPVGGITTMVLADFGAEVIKVEPPGGDPLRRLAASPLWLRGKRSAVLDLRDAVGRQQLHALVAGADVVVASFAPGQAQQLGADWESISQINPRLVYCSITAWGPSGPLAQYPGYEGVVAAKIGRMNYFAGQPRREGPAFCAVPVASHGASQAALSGILGALIARDRDGMGQLVETSLLQGAFASDLFGMVRAQLAERFPGQFGNDPYATYGLPTLQYQPVVTKDGKWVQLANLLEHHFHAFLASIGLAHIYAEERFMGTPSALSPGVREELRTMMIERVRERTLEEWMALWAADPNVGAEPFQTTQEALWHPDLIANGDIGEHAHPELGTVRQLGLLAQLEATPGAVGGPAPSVGQHTDDVLGDVRKPAPATGVRGPTQERPPLDGTTVVDFSSIIAAPLGISALADLGARVIKVEPIEGDPYRGMGAGFGMYVGIAKTTAGKESICLDLKTSAGRGIAHRLIKGADMVVHNFRPGVPERLGIGYDEVRSINPLAIYLHCTGYGTRGPNAASVAAHPIAGAGAGGALFQAGRAMPPQEAGTIEEIKEAARWLYRANEGNPDPNSAVVVGAAAMLALFAKHRAGAGQEVRLSMLGANGYANSDDFLSYEGKRSRPSVDSELYGLGPLYRLYHARDGWIFIAVTNDHEWEEFCRATGHEEWTIDGLFSTNDARMANERLLTSELEQLFVGQAADEWEHLLVPRGVGCVRADADTPGTFFAHSEQMASNGFAPETVHAMWGSYRRWGPAVTLHRTPGRYGPGVLAGEQTDSLLAEVGFNRQEITRLRKDRVVASEVAPALPHPAPGVAP